MFEVKPGSVRRRASALVTSAQCQASGNDTPFLVCAGRIAGLAKTVYGLCRRDGDRGTVAEFKKGETMNHLSEAKMFARQAESTSVDLMQAYAQLATVHGIIALVERMDKAAYALTAIAERMDKAANDADVAAERAELIAERGQL